MSSEGPWSCRGENRSGSELHPLPEQGLAALSSSAG